MRLLIQRVKKASVMIEGRLHASIGEGLLVYAGVGAEDGCIDARNAKEKILNFRIFSDETGRMNRNVKEHGGCVMLVSQFTLSADLSRGNRPSFDSAMKPEEAERLYNELLNELSAEIETKSGVFGAVMDIESVNHGPATFIMEIKC